MFGKPTVVLLHGLFGFSRVLSFDYYRHIPSRYRDMGLRVVTPRVPWAGTIEARATALCDALADEEGPLHLVAHSMGGLDARYWITHLGGAAKVASLTTLSTPHRGSPAADFVCTHHSPFRLFAGVHDLTTWHMRSFNAETPDHPEVIYRSYSAARPLDQLPWFVRNYGRLINEREGKNDAQVSVDSAVWGEHLGTLPCDHYELIMRNFWLNPFRGRTPYSPEPIYRKIGEWIIEQQQQSH